MKRILWTLAAITMTALSCSKQENEGEITPPINGQEEVTYLKINSVTAVEPTKAAIKDTKFPTKQEASIGLFLVGEGYTDAKYSNIKYTKPAGADVWTDPQIELIEGKAATVYAYYPYNADITDIVQIQLASSINGNDWMRATPIADVSTTKPSIDLSLNHALALVEITFNVFGPEGTMTNVTVAGGDGAFSKAGTLDATQGTITPDKEQAATKTSPFPQDVELTVSDGKIIADCLLVPGKTGTEADARQDFYIKCTYNGKTLSASLTGDNGVIIRQGTKSTVSLNIKPGDSKMEIVSVGVDQWDDNVSGNTAEVDGHTVTFNCPEGFKYEMRVENETTALFDETVDGNNKTSVIFRYEKKEVTLSRFFFLSEPSGCSFTHDAQNGVITVTDLTQDITIDVGYGTYIPYTATAKVEPTDEAAFGFPYDDARSTFSGGSGVIAILGELETIGRVAFDANTSLTGVDLSGCENLKTIKEYAFNGCTKLTSVKLPEGLEAIEYNAFWHMGLESDAQPQKITFPSTLKSIGNWAFAEARISGIDGFGSNFKSLGEGAFIKCLPLTSVDLSKCSGLTAISVRCFEDSDNLESIDLSGCTSLKTINSQGFNNCNILTSVTLPPSLETIGDNAFWGMGADAKGERYGSDYPQIPGYYFSGAKDLVLPNTLKSIGQFAFENATIFRTTLPVSLKTVGESAFKGSCIHEVTILAEEKDGVETGAAIGSNMFVNCGTLYEIHFKYKNPPVLVNNFVGGGYLDKRSGLLQIKNGAGFYMPQGTANAYKEAWKEYDFHPGLFEEE